MLAADGNPEVWSRSAAFLLRQVLEQKLKDIIEKKYGKFIVCQGESPPTFSSQLVVLRTLVDKELAAEVAWAWSALSAATHAHSYELPATGSELQRWLETVERLVNNEKEAHSNGDY